MKAKRPTRTTANASSRSRESAKKPQARRKSRGGRETKRVPSDAQPRGGRKTTRDARPARSAPRTTPIARPVDAPARPKSASQAKARAKARKAKAPKVVRPPLRERLLVKLASIELNPRRLVARVPFVVLVISALGVGLGVTLWLSTDAAERSYQLGNARELNQALMQQKEALERDVLQAQAAPALAEAARQLGMIPSRDTAHLVQDPSGNWVVVGTPKPAEGVPPPPLNAPLPDPAPPAPPAPRVVEPREVPVRIPSAATPLVVVPGTPGAPGVPAAPVAPGVTGVEVPHAVSGQLPIPGPVAPVAPAEPLAPAPLAPAPLIPGAPA
ncbi:hypothetical protein ACAG24_017005 [Mycobacterium sp. pW049]|uniref:hypothetical protein n=1 Tax=[Mycobacterium] bulgaricum TaxID=3238985 RepID=UPI00351AD2F3